MKVYQQPKTIAEKEHESKLLELNGIKKDSTRRKSKKKYRFFIYQYEVVALFQTTHNRSGGQPWLNKKTLKKELWQKISTRSLSKELIKAKKLAVQSLYVLGYDLGMVEICTYSTVPKYTVSKLFFHQGVARDLESELQQAIQALEQQEKAVENKETVMGADVELVLRHTSGKYVVASKYFTKKGVVGHDAIWLKGHRNRYPLVELRPKPSKSPTNLYTNLDRCLAHGVIKINDPSIEWLAGGQPLKKYPIGGHIHFSQTVLTAPFIRALDNYLTLPLSLLESKESLSRRPKYGALGDFREQFHGGFEYRTPPSWMVDPIITKGVLCLAKVISKEYKQLVLLPLLSYATQKDFYEGNRDSLIHEVQKLWTALRSTASYVEYQKPLDRFYELIEKGYVWKEYTDIRKAWKLPPYE